MESDTLRPLFQWISANPGWADLVVFLTAMLESLAFVGVAFPGVAMMIGFGALVSNGTIQFWPTLFWAIAGAIVGDGISFWIGHHFRHSLHSMRPFSTHPELLEKGVAFFHRYGAISVLLGRFVGPIRPIIPVVAGMLGMETGRFFVVNILSALAWGPAYLLPGMAIATSWPWHW